MNRPVRAAFVGLFALAIAVVPAMTVITGVTPAIAAGPTALTIAGKIDKTNRGPVEPFADAFLKSHDIAFDRAYAFDLETLAGIGMHRLTARYPGSDRVVDVEGPLLRDVLNQVGARGDTVTIMAFDGYAADIPVTDIERWPIVLALKTNGEWLGLGDRGPAWVVYPSSDFPALTGRDDAAWVWAAFFIRVE